MKFLTRNCNFFFLFRRRWRLLLRRQRRRRVRVVAEPKQRRVDRVDDLLARVGLQVAFGKRLGEDLRPDRQIFLQRFQKLFNSGSSLRPANEILRRKNGQIYSGNDPFSDFLFIFSLFIFAPF